VHVVDIDHESPVKILSDSSYKCGYLQLLLKACGKSFELKITIATLLRYVTVRK
jgi:hypothetical protein